MIPYARTVLIESCLSLHLCDASKAIRSWHLEQKGSWLRLLHGSLLRALLLCFRTAHQQDQGESKVCLHETRIQKYLCPPNIPEIKEKKNLSTIHTASFQIKGEKDLALRLCRHPHCFCVSQCMIMGFLVMRMERHFHQFRRSRLTPLP